MPVRVAVPEDLPRLVELGTDMHAEGLYRVLALRHTKLEASLLACVLTTGTRLVLVWEAEGEVVGLFVAQVAPTFFSDELIASDFLHYVDPRWRGRGALRAMLARYVAWAQERGVKHITVGVSTGGDTERTERIYQRLGFRRTGGNFVYGE